MLLRTHHSHLGNDATRSGAGRARALSIGRNVDLLAGNDAARGGARGAGALVVGGNVNLGEGDDDGQGSEDEDARAPIRSGRNGTSDPYAGLDSAFGSYMADGPAPMRPRDSANGQNGAEDDDLLL